MSRHLSKTVLRYWPENIRREVAEDRKIRRRAAGLGLFAFRDRKVGGWGLDRRDDGKLLAGPGLTNPQILDVIADIKAGRRSA